MITTEFTWTDVLNILEKHYEYFVNNNIEIEKEIVAAVKEINLIGADNFSTVMSWMSMLYIQHRHQQENTPQDAA